MLGVENAVGRGSVPAQVVATSVSRIQSVIQINIVARRVVLKLVLASYVAPPTTAGQPMNAVFLTNVLIAVVRSVVEVGGRLGAEPPFFKLWGAEPPFYFRKSRIYYVTEEIQSSGDTKYRMYSCPRTTRENVTMVHLRSRISVTISTKIFSFDLN